MIVQLRFFASLRERLKMSEATREVPPGTTAAALWNPLSQNTLLHNENC